MLSRLLATPPKRSAFQSTTIFRLPTPRKPPKSITAARTVPSRSTITSTTRPISSFAALRTSRPRMPWASVATNPQVDAGRPKLKIAQRHLAEELRQTRVTKPDLAARGIEFQTERCLQQSEGRRTCPGLRRAGYGIEHRPAPSLPPKSAEQF